MDRLPGSPRARVHARHWYRAGGSSIFAAGDGYGRRLSTSGDASVVAYQWLTFTDGDPHQPNYDVGVWEAVPGWFDPTPDAGDFGNPVLSRDGERLYMSSGEPVEQFGVNLYLEPEELWYVELDGSNTVRRPEPGSVPLSEITGSGNELLFLRSDPAVERDQPHAWSRI